MEEIYTILASWGVSSETHVRTVKGHSILIDEFIKNPDFCLFGELWDSELLRLSQEKRTPWMESIIFVAISRANGFRHKYDIPTQFIKQNKHNILKILHSSTGPFKIKINHFRHIVDGDKYILNTKIRENTAKNDLNFLQMYCQANYGDFHTYNDWDLDFIYQ